MSVMFGPPPPPPTAPTTPSISDLFSDLLQLVDEPGRALIAFDLDTLTNTDGKLRGGMESLVALEAMYHSASLFLTTSNSPATAVAAACNISIGAFFSCEPLHHERILKSLSLCNVRSPRDLTVKIATYLSLDTSIPVRELAASKVPLKETLAKAPEGDLHDLLSLYITTTNHSGPGFRAFDDSGFLSTTMTSDEVCSLVEQSLMLSNRCIGRDVNTLTGGRFTRIISVPDVNALEAAIKAAAAGCDRVVRLTSCKINSYAVVP